MAPIHLAAEVGDVPGVESLLESNGSLVQCVAANGWTPILEAAYEGHVGVVCLLLDRGADMNYRSPSGYTALYLACARGHVEITRLLLDRGADPCIGRPLLLAASEAGHVDIVRLLLSRRVVDVDETDGTGGTTALMEACSCGRSDVARVLLDAGADWMRPNKAGMTAMMQAKDHNHRCCIRLLEETSRSYMLHKARFIHEMTLRRSLFPLAPQPDMLKLRRHHGIRQPKVAMSFMAGHAREPPGSEAFDCSRSRTAGVLAAALEDLPGDLFTELLEVLGPMAEPQQ